MVDCVKVVEMASEHFKTAFPVLKGPISHRLKLLKCSGT